MVGHGDGLHQVGAEEHSKICSVDFPPVVSGSKVSAALELITGREFNTCDFIVGGKGGRAGHQKGCARRRL